MLNPSTNNWILMLIQAVLLLMTLQTAVASPILSYSPSCLRNPTDPTCTSGTEVQVLTSHEGILFAGTTNWMESNPTIWPRRSAQVLYLDREDGEWNLTSPIPDSTGQCRSGSAPWEQVNDLHSADLSGQGSHTLLAAVLANEDGGCPGLQGTVFFMDSFGEWRDSGLGSRLASYYKSGHTEVRFVVSHRDKSGECPASNPCLFAFVNPRKTPGARPTVWRGRCEAHRERCDSIAWGKEPEVAFDGISLPVSKRILSVTSAGDLGLFVGLSVDTINPRYVNCRSSDSLKCPKASLIRRSSSNHWTTLWQGPPTMGSNSGRDADLAIRGIQSFTYQSGESSVWFVTIRQGRLYRMDFDEFGQLRNVVMEVSLIKLMPEPCSNVYPYQIHLHPESRYPRLLLASQACVRDRGNSFARIFDRSVERGSNWRVLELPTIANDFSNVRVNEAAVRWIQTSPFDPRNIFFGTTDMNSGSASLTARIYRLTNPFR